MSHWEGPLAVFDLETTGVDVDKARIVTACVALLDADGEVTHRWDWLADPEVEIPEQAAAIHGVSTEYARTYGRPAAVVVAEITATLSTLAALEVPLVVYNAPYDLSLLDRECRRRGIDPLETPSRVVDPLVLDKKVDRYRKGKRTLEVTAALYEVALDEAHDAGADAIAAGRVARALIARYGEQLDIAPERLHARQIDWYREQAESFQDYIHRVKGDTSFVADKAWPVRLPEFPQVYVDTQPMPAIRHQAAGPLALRGTPVAPPAPEADHEADVEPEPGPESETSAATPAEPAATELMDLPAAADRVDTALIDAVRVEHGREPQGSASAPPADSDAAPLAEAVDLLPEVEQSPADPAPDRAPRVRRTVLRIAAAVVTDPEGRALLVRKRGTDAFMQPGGKIEPGESAFQTIVRELEEELGLVVDPDRTEHLGSFRAAAANEADTDVIAEAFALETADPVEARQEIEELLWIDSAEVEGRTIAPLSVEYLLPLWQERRGRLF